ncbi:acyl-ACP thioesterase [Lactococcus hodotermopsidis]|uniref:Acyl-ACP thioesterase n=1 Tax=Pseudolactococcus hodotermopsidis TaxID=2709157 RepID=A0A6A0BCK5_9LACT|nr:acyl-ACP thioesterase domain-containing protein [Lactococcus hodotermopsidis]GFH42576.1 acyl-ACP thioesterase [Lactococcus hodotermopsidis]
MLIYKNEFTVPYYESDVTGNIKLPSLFNIALQLSGEQGAILNRSDQWTKAHYNYTWIVVEYEVDIQRLPVFNETMTIETFAKTYNKFFCYRDFIFYAENGDELLKISSTWVLIDVDTRKVAHVEDEIVAPYQSEKIKRIIRGHRFRELKLEPTCERNYFVRFNDIDQNGHVNNSKYLDWMIDMLDFDFLSTHVPQKIYLKYAKEVLYGVSVKSRAEVVGEQSFHEILTDDLNAQAEIIWRKNDDL